MKNYFRTLIAGVLGLIGGSIGYFKGIPIVIQLLITVLAGIIVGCMALYEKKKQLENDKETLIFKMKHHLNNDYHTNHSDSEKPMEAQRLNWYFRDADKTLKLEAIAIVLKVSQEEVKNMLEIKIPEYLIKTDEFSVTRR